VNRKQNPAWVELVQLIPVISFALPFVLAGSVDLSRARPGFVVGAVLSVAVYGLVRATKHLVNPILLGTGVWLCVGAVAFGLPFEPVMARLIAVQGFALFFAVFGVGVLATAFSPHGYIGGRSDNPRAIQRASLALLGVTAVILVWSWVFRSDVRIGGGLPFIVLNITRRVLLRRAL
jgi:hypothetical protein